MDTDGLYLWLSVFICGLLQFLAEVRSLRDAALNLELWPPRPVRQPGPADSL